MVYLFLQFRSKTTKTSRVASPINIGTKTTPTRRSAAAAATAALAALSHAGRSSPFSNTTTNQHKTIAHSINSDMLASLSNSSSSSSSSSITNEMENVIRRKLRSHTRQLQFS